MNLKEIEYIVKIAEERNVTRAAKKLFLTPSALNQQLLHLEREIGTPLFFRSRTGWSPTEAGEVYLSAAREMLRLKRETYHRLQDITDAKKALAPSVSRRKEAPTCSPVSILFFIKSIQVL